MGSRRNAVKNKLNALRYHGGPRWCCSTQVSSLCTRIEAIVQRHFPAEEFETELKSAFFVRCDEQQHSIRLPLHLDQQSSYESKHFADNYLRREGKNTRIAVIEQNSPAT